MKLGWLGRVHIIYGILFFVIFLITGQFMRADFPDKEAISQELRLLMRSRHIYILFSSAAHVLLGLYVSFDKTRWRKILQILGSVLLFVSTGILLAGFVYETYFTEHFSRVSPLGIYLTLPAVAFHCLAGIAKASSNKN